MNYVTTNIRIPEVDYVRLKNEAVAKRVSFAEVVRTRLSDIAPKFTKDEAEKIIAETNKTAKILGKKFRGIDVVETIRNMRKERSEHLWKLSTYQ